MVLWEITLGTAYFLGLKRTYRLALRMQRRIVSSKRPKIRQFLHRRTRAVFDVALKVHRSIQERDIEVGRSVGNFILRWLDRMKPSAEIRVPPKIPPSNSTTKHTTHTSNQKPSGYSQTFGRDSDRHFFTSSSNMWPKSFPTIAIMMRPTKPAGTWMQYRQLSLSATEVLGSRYRANWPEGVIRKDILQFMLQK